MTSPVTNMQVVESEPKGSAAKGEARADVEAEGEGEVAAKGGANAKAAERARQAARSAEVRVTLGPIRRVA